MQCQVAGSRAPAQRCGVSVPATGGSSVHAHCAGRVGSRRPGPRRLVVAAASAGGVESVKGVDPALTPIIRAAMATCLSEVDLDIKGEHYVVRAGLACCGKRGG